MKKSTPMKEMRTSLRLKASLQDFLVVPAYEVFTGSWVWDESYPLYRSVTCRFLDEGFRCSENHRPDDFYTKWPWQPNSCNLLRFPLSPPLINLPSSFEKKSLVLGGSKGLSLTTGPHLKRKNPLISTMSGIDGDEDIKGLTKEFVKYEGTTCPHVHSSIEVSPKEVKSAPESLKLEESQGVFGSNVGLTELAKSNRKLWSTGVFDEGPKARLRRISSNRRRSTLCPLKFIKGKSDFRAKERTLAAGALGALHLGRQPSPGLISSQPPIWPRVQISRATCHLTLQLASHLASLVPHLPHILPRGLHLARAVGAAAPGTRPPRHARGPQAAPLVTGGRPFLSASGNRRLPRPRASRRPFTRQQVVVQAVRFPPALQHCSTLRGGSPQAVFLYHELQYPGPGFCPVVLSGAAKASPWPDVLGSDFLAQPVTCLTVSVPCPRPRSHYRQARLLLGYTGQAGLEPSPAIFGTARPGGAGLAFSPPLSARRAENSSSCFRISSTDRSVRP
ncbi:trichome birefringence-like 11 protein [Nymphaea thermarum]|nr:trichome birefringence-like 11 protein [Nymphaea thermarum]